MRLHELAAVVRREAGRRCAVFGAASLGAFTVLLGVAPASGPFDPLAPYLEVRRVLVRFAAQPEGTSAFSFDAWFWALPGVAFDPLTDSVEIALGTDDTCRVDPGVWRMSARRRVLRFRRPRAEVGEPTSPFRRMVLDLRRGRVRAVVDNAGHLGVRDGSAWSVSVALRLGDASFATTADFAIRHRGRFWTSPRRPDQLRYLDGWRASGIDDPRTLVIGDEATWTALWREHVGSTDAMPPEVDFARDLVVAIVRQHNLFCGFYVAGVESLQDRIVVHYRNLPCGPHCLVPAQWLSTAAIFAIPRTDLPVEFEERDRMLDCRDWGAR